MKKFDPPSEKSRNFQWWYENDVDTGVCQGLKLSPLYSTESNFQKIDVWEHPTMGRVLTLDNVVQTTQADEFVYHEMMTHVPLVGKGNKKPVSVLIIGGGDGGTLREVLRHEQVKRVVMAEIDETVIEVSKKYLGIHGDYEDPRVELIIGDGAAYVKSDAVRQKPFDLVIIDSGDPVGPGKILFSEMFCQAVHDALTPGGIMQRHLGVPAYQRQVFKEGVRDMKAVFNSIEIYRAAVPTYTGGDMAFALGFKNKTSCMLPQEEISGRYYNSNVHQAAFALPTWWLEVIREIDEKHDPFQEPPPLQ